MENYLNFEKSVLPAYASYVEKVLAFIQLFYEKTIKPYCDKNGYSFKKYAEDVYFIEANGSYYGGMMNFDEPTDEQLASIIRVIDTVPPGMNKPLGTFIEIK